MKQKVLIVLDSFEYKNDESDLQEVLCDMCLPFFYYTKYENKLTEFFQKTKYIGSFLTHIIYWILSLSYAIKIVVSKYSEADKVVFINPIVGIFYACLKRLLFLKQHVSIAGFLFENKQNALYYRIRTCFVLFCYKKVDNIFVYGEDEVIHYKNIFPSLASKFKYVKYGRDFKYINKREFNYRNKYIASGGRSNRSYKTLCEAIRLLNLDAFSLDCLIATRPECVTSDMEKSPVIFQYGITLNQFGSFIENSVLFVLPLINTNLSAGHMAMMEAMANGKLIIVTDIQSIRDYVTDNEVIFYKADNSQDLADKIQYTIDNLSSPEMKRKAENGKMLYINEYSFKAMLKRIVTETLK